MKTDWLELMLVLTLVIVLFSSVNADPTFSRVYSGFDPYGIHVAIAANGGFFISCIVCPDRFQGVMWLLKTDDDGNILWSRPFFESNTKYRDFESGAYILSTPDGGCLITGQGEPRATGKDTEVCLVKVDSNGVIMWEQIIGDDDEHVYTVSGIAGSDNGCLLAISQKYQNSFFVMYDQEGNEIWRTEYIGEEYYIEAVTATNDGRFLAIVENIYGSNFWMMKMDGSGHMEFFPDSLNVLINDVTCVRQTDDGGYVICGKTDSYDAFLMRTDEQGSELWRYTSGIDGIDRATWVEPTKKGMFALTGLEKVGDVYDGWLALIDDAGEMQWKRYYSFPGYDQISCVCPTDDGGFILCGKTGDSYENRGVWLLKTDSEGLVNGSEDGYISITECIEVFTQPLGWVVSCEVTEDSGSAEINAETLDRELGIETGYLWIPEWHSLSGYEGWLVYLGPFWWLNDPELERVSEEILELYPDAYLIFVGSEPERSTLPLLE